MRLLDHSFDDPAENLACDEMLLNEAEDGDGGEALRLWESPVLFVVLGVSQKLLQEVHEPACLADGVPILRRCSAGGCVLQGPGCLNYSLVLSTEARSEVASIRGAYQEVSGRLGDAFARRGLDVRHSGISDLTVLDRKVSGNAQKRRRRFILYHGTLLYAMPSEPMARYLQEPIDRPDYRGTRIHGAFVSALPLNQRALKEVVRSAFEPNLQPDTLTAHEHEAVRMLAETKYRQDAWIRRR